MTAGDIYTVVGNTTWGDSANGTAIGSAEFDGITGRALDASGDLYLADSGNNRVRRGAGVQRHQMGVHLRDRQRDLHRGGQRHRRAHR